MVFETEMTHVNDVIQNVCQIDNYPIKCQSCPHIEISQVAGFYMRATLIFNGLICFPHFILHNTLLQASSNFLVSYYICIIHVCMNVRIIQIQKFSIYYLLVFFHSVLTLPSRLVFINQKTNSFSAFLSITVSLRLIEI